MKKDYIPTWILVIFTLCGLSLEHTESRKMGSSISKLLSKIPWLSCCDIAFRLACRNIETHFRICTHHAIFQSLPFYLQWSFNEINITKRNGFLYSASSLGQFATFASRAYGNKLYQFTLRVYNSPKQKKWYMLRSIYLIMSHFTIGFISVTNPPAFIRASLWILNRLNGSPGNSGLKSDATAHVSPDFKCYRSNFQIIERMYYKTFPIAIALVCIFLFTGEAKQARRQPRCKVVKLLLEYDLRCSETES